MTVGSRGRHRQRAPGWLLLVLLAGIGCSTSRGDDGDTTMPHGDHTPKFGGLVLMDGDLHFEVVARRSGHYRVYFSDATRAPVPASQAVDVVVTVIRPNQETEVLHLEKDAADESWVGEGRVIEHDDTTVRVSYVHQDKPYSIDLPIAGWR